MKTLKCLLIKDLRLMYSGKFFVASLITLTVFSLYINFIYASLDSDVQSVSTYEGSVSSSEPVTVNITGKFDRETKNRREITNEVLFFEVITISFLGIASMLFKEKSMGVIRIHGIMPVSLHLFILSKWLLFLLSDILYAALLIALNIGLEPFFSTFLFALPHICILSAIMGLLGFVCAFLYKDFKQFSISFALIILIITVPVYLGGNRTTGWTWLHYYPVYHLFMGLKNAFFYIKTQSPLYYITAFLSICSLMFLVHKQLKKEITKG